MNEDTISTSLHIEAMRLRRERERDAFYVTWTLHDLERLMTKQQYSRCRRTPSNDWHLTVWVRGLLFQNPLPSIMQYLRSVRPVTVFHVIIASVCHPLVTCILTSCLLYVCVCVYIYIYIYTYIHTNKVKNSQHNSESSIDIWKWSLSTEEKRGTTFRSSTDEIFGTLTWNNKTR